MKDFFFGELRSAKDGVSLSLSDALTQCKKVSKDFYTNQINRLLQEHKKRLVLTDGTSMPAFRKLIKHVSQEAIGYIEIYARTDINNNVEATLACDIVMAQGTLTVIPHWCAYKELRADEIFSTLLIPLHLKGLHKRAFIRWEDGSTAHLTPSQSDYEEEVGNIFVLAGYPLRRDEDDRRTAKRHALDLKLATDIGEKGLSDKEAWDELCKVRAENLNGVNDQ